MAMGNATAKRSHALGPESIDREVRACVYGGLVGQMMNEIDARLVQPSVVSATDPAEDFIHKISVASGYIGLAAGFGAAAASLFLIL